MYRECLLEFFVTFCFCSFQEKKRQMKKERKKRYTYRMGVGVEEAIKKKYQSFIQGIVWGEGSVAGRYV